MSNSTKMEKKLYGGIFVVVFLTICLCVTTYYLIWSAVLSDDELLHPGRTKINLNDGKPIIEEYEFLFEPGMTVKKDFFIKNQSSRDVYYRLYFDQVEGGLADVLQITIMYGEKVIYQGTAAELSRNTVQAAEDILRENEQRELEIYFYLPDESGNQMQDQSLSFDMCADAVQTKNNPERSFE